MVELVIFSVIQLSWFDLLKDKYSYGIKLKLIKNSTYGIIHNECNNHEQLKIITLRLSIVYSIEWCPAQHGELFCHRCCLRRDGPILWYIMFRTITTYSDKQNMLEIKWSNSKFKWSNHGILSKYMNQNSSSFIFSSNLPIHIWFTVAIMSVVQIKHQRSVHTDKYGYSPTPISKE